MRRAMPSLLLLAALGGCGSPPTEQEANLEERASGPEVAPVDPANAAINGPQATDAGERAGIGGSTQGPTAQDSDAPYAGDDSSTRSN